MPLLNPLIKAQMTMTTVTPMATPRIVRAARILWARSDARAMPTPSNRAVTATPGAARRSGRAAPRGWRDRRARHTGGEGRGRRDEEREPDAGDDAERRADGRDRGRFGEKQP